MVLILERTGSLLDLRRTQRRVAALLLNDSHVKLQKFKLRRRLVQQSVCHVCSRLDPGGVFRRPNDHLYQKGFFHSDNHLDLQNEAVHIPDHLTNIISKDEKSVDDSEENQPEEISVTIRRGSKSTKHHSPLKREKSHDSYVTDYKYERKAISENVVKIPNSDSTSKIILPPITQDRGSRLSNRSFNTIKKSSIVGAPSVEISGLPRKSPYISETIHPGSVSDMLKDDRITIIPTSFDDKSVVSGLSTFNEGTTPSNSSNDLDSKLTTMLEKTISATMPTRRSVTPHDGKQSLPDNLTVTISSQITSPFDQSTERDIRFAAHQDKAQCSITHPPLLVREDAMITEHRDVPERPNAGLKRERTMFMRSHRSGSSVPSKSVQSNPDPGYDIQGTNYEHNFERVTTEIGNYSDSGSSRVISEDATIILSERTADTLHHRGQQETKCRCSTSERVVSRSQNICRACGKIFHQDSRTAKSGLSQSINSSRAESYMRASSSTRCPSSRQQMLQHNNTVFNIRSKTTLDNNTKSGISTEDGHVTRLTRSKTSLDEDTINRTNLKSQSTSEDNHVTRMNIRSKPVIDEDYMDLDSIIYEDDGRYWSSSDESTSPSSWYRHAHPFPLVNPDIHKLVYMQALKASRLQGKKKIEDFDEMIRRSHVFSYIPLHPCRKKTQPQDCGLRPCQSIKPKKGQLMKHIFGDISLDNFYKGTGDKNKHEVILEQSSSEEYTDNNISVKDT